jgi:uncharacterized ferredoxin-like protein
MQALKKIVNTIWANYARLKHQIDHAVFVKKNAYRIYKLLHKMTKRKGLDFVKRQARNIRLHLSFIAKIKED